MLLYSTLANQKDAEHLAREACKLKLAACVNIISNGKSIYLYKNEIHQDEEVYILFKTTVDLVEKLEQFVISNHTYDLPAILKWECGVSDDFYNYMNNFSQDVG